MANCSAVNGAGHQCTWPDGHKKHGFVGIGGTNASRPTVEVHGYWNPAGHWEIWPVNRTVAPATPAKTSG